MPAASPARTSAALAARTGSRPAPASRAAMPRSAASIVSGAAAATLPAAPRAASAQARTDSVTPATAVMAAPVSARATPSRPYDPRPGRQLGPARGDKGDNH